MTPTEISEHAKEAAKSFRTLELKDFPYDIGSAFDISVHRAIQHGINLAVESKDRRIAELEAECWNLKNASAERFEEIQSKDREIERLKEQSKETNAALITSVVAVQSAHDAFDILAHEGDSLRSQLTEANAKLARKTEQSETWLSELQSVNEKLRSLDTHCSDVEAEKSSALAKLSSAQAEIERLKEAMKQIWDETDPYADGTPDSGAMALLANQISGIARQFVFLTPTK